MEKVICLNIYGYGNSAARCQTKNCFYALDYSSLPWKSIQISQSIFGLATCKTAETYHIKSSSGKTDGRNAMRHACGDAYRSNHRSVKTNDAWLAPEHAGIRDPRPGCLHLFYRWRLIRILMIIQTNISLHLLIAHKGSWLGTDDATAFCRQHPEYIVSP